METILRIFVFIFGLLVVSWTLFSAIRSFVLPRGMPDFVTRSVFIVTWQIFRIRLHWAQTYLERDRIAAFFAPVATLLLLPVWVALILIGFAGMYWALGVEPFTNAVILSGSSMLTLGFRTSEVLVVDLIMFCQATIGLILVALLIAYLPTMYAAFSRREEAINLLEVRAGNPPSAIEMLLRYNRIHGLGRLSELWRSWEIWFANLEESHTSLPALVFFRSARPEHSWITSAGAVLDAASLTLSSIDTPYDANAALCIRAGYLALRRICDYLDLPYTPNPHYPEQPISITKDEFLAAVEDLTKNGVPIKEDREQAWLDFAGWRVNYDDVLLNLAGITMPPIAPWSSDRAKGFSPVIFPWKDKKKKG